MPALIEGALSCARLSLYTKCTLEPSNNCGSLKTKSHVQKPTYMLDLRELEAVVSNQRGDLPLVVSRITYCFSYRECVLWIL